MIGSTASFDPWKFLAYKDECDGEQLEELLKDHLVNVALCAKTVACGLNTRLGRRELDEGVAFVAGLLHDIGKAFCRYQQNVMRGFRDHELLSAILAELLLKDQMDSDRIFMVIYAIASHHQAHRSLLESIGRRAEYKVDYEGLKCMVLFLNSVLAGLDVVERELKHLNITIPRDLEDKLKSISIEDAGAYVRDLLRNYANRLGGEYREVIAKSRVYAGLLMACDKKVSVESRRSQRCEGRVEGDEYYDSVKRFYDLYTVPGCT